MSAEHAKRSIREQFICPKIMLSEGKARERGKDQKRKNACVANANISGIYTKRLFRRDILGSFDV